MISAEDKFCMKGLYTGWKKPQQKNGKKAKGIGPSGSVGTREVSTGQG